MSGASELARQGVPLADIILFRTWLCEHFAREYIRRGEVAVVRALHMMGFRQQQQQQQQQQGMQQWCALGLHAWAFYGASF